MEPTFILYIIAVLAVLTAACSVAALIKVSKNRDNERLSDEIKTVKSLTERGFAATGASYEAQTNAVYGRLGELTKSNADQQRELVKNIADIREELSAASRRQTEAVAAAVEKMQASNEKKLDEMRATVDEKLTSTLSERLDGSFKNVSDQLNNVYKSLGEMQKLSGDIDSLSKLFTGVKLRGTWAEAQLKGILEKTVPGMFVENYSPKDVSGFVEFAVTVPDTDGGITYLPIDSKFPAEDYIRLTEAAETGDTDGVKSARAALAKRVIAEAKDVKKYISPPETTPFAVMYLATDALYAEVVSLPDNVTDRIHEDFSVLLAGPSTVTALLSSLAMGFKTVALNRKAADVMNILAEAKKQYNDFAGALEKARRRMNEAGAALDEAAKRNNIIVKKLKSVESAENENADGTNSAE